MTNFTDTSYLARICYTPFILVWMIIRTWQTSRQESFSLSRLIRLEPRPFFTYTFILALLAQLAHDILLYFIKTNEGFIKTDDIEPIIIEKPESEWNKNNLQLNNISNYLDSISLSFTISSLFTLQTFWCYIMEQMSRKEHVGIWEYWISLVLAIVIIPIFPILTYLLSILIKNPNYEENLPRLIGSGIALILCLIGGLRVHFEIIKLLNSKYRPILQNQGKLKYFQDLNIWFNFSLFIWSASYLIISLDSILPTSIIVKSRFISDLLIINSNFGGFIFYICLISIFNPGFSFKQKSRAISEPFDVSKTNSGFSEMMMFGQDGDAQIKIETNQDIKIEQAFINPPYRPYSTTPPITPNSVNILTPMPSPSSAFAGIHNNKNYYNNNNQLDQLNQHKISSLSPLKQSWKQGQGQSISDSSSQQTFDNDQAILTEHVDRFGANQVIASDDEEYDESWQRENYEDFNEPNQSNEPQIFVENYDYNDDDDDVNNNYDNNNNNNNNNIYNSHSNNIYHDDNIYQNNTTYYENNINNYNNIDNNTYHDNNIDNNTYHDNNIDNTYHDNNIDSNNYHDNNIDNNYRDNTYNTYQNNPVKRTTSQKSSMYSRSNSF